MLDRHSRNGFLTRAGLGLVAQQLSLEGLSPLGGVDSGEDLSYLDKVVSVNGLRRDEDMYASVTNKQIDEQARRFHNGS